MPRVIEYGARGLFQECVVNQQPRARKDQLISEEVAGECVVYDSRQKKAHHLNSTLTWVWSRCDGTMSIDAMAAAFERQFDVKNGRDILLPGLKQLADCQLLENPLDLSDIAADENNGISRRAMVAGGSILMPAVISMVAPTPAAAKSSKDPKIKIKL